MTPSSFPYLTDLLNQPQALRDTLQAMQSAPGLAGLTTRVQNGDFRRIILTGMGSSLTVFYPLYHALARQGLNAQIIETGELLHHLDSLLTPDTLVIAASQSGQSAETVALLSHLENLPDRPTVLGVSNTPGSPLAVRSSACLLTRAGAETTVACKTYVAALLALAWLEPVLLGQPVQSRLTELASTADAVQSYLDSWESHVDRLQAELRGVNEVFVVGRGPSLAAALTGGLIIKEATHVHGEGMSSAAFRHGPLDMVNKEVFVLVYEGPAKTADLNRRLVEDIRAAGGLAGLVSTNGEGPFRLPAVPESVVPIVEILPAQMMTLALAALRGHEAGRFSRATKITATE